MVQSRHRVEKVTATPIVETRERVCVAIEPPIERTGLSIMVTVLFGLGLSGIIKVTDGKLRQTVSKRTEHMGGSEASTVVLVT